MPRVLPDEVEERGRRTWASMMREHLERTGKTRQALAEECRVSRAQLDKYLNGEVSPPGKHLAALGDAVGVDIFDELAALGWLDNRDALRHQRDRIKSQKLRLHFELQRLVELEAEVNDVDPATPLVTALVREGWQVAQWLDVRGKKRPVSFASLLALTPPSPEASKLALNEQVSLDGLPSVDRTARGGLTLGEEELRRTAERILGSERLHGQDPYWHERPRHTTTYREMPAAANPGLVLAVPNHLRRRVPPEEATVLKNVQSDRRINSLAFVGLPYCGAPDLAAMVAQEVLGWGYAGVGMLTRERWRVWPNEDRDLMLETGMAKLLASGDDSRVQRTVWHLNFPQVIPPSVGLLADAESSAAVVHLRFTDASLESFLHPYWGNDSDRTLPLLRSWRASCDEAEQKYRENFGNQDWLTLDVDLNSNDIGIDEQSEDRRIDYYLGDLGRPVEDWIRRIYGRERLRLNGPGQALLEIASDGDDIAELTRKLSRSASITERHAEQVISNIQTRFGFNSTRELVLYARRNST